MDNDRVRSYLVGAAVCLCVVACACVSFQIGRARGYGQGFSAALQVPAKSDTVWRTDTHFVDRPVEVWKTIEKPVYFAVHDTQIVRTTDSVFVALQRERRGYSGEEYRAAVSGVDPRLDWIEVYPKTSIVTKEVRVEVPAPQRWRRVGFGVAAGPGVFWQPGMDNVSPGVGILVGIRVNL